MKNVKHATIVDKLTKVFSLSLQVYDNHLNIMSSKSDSEIFLQRCGDGTELGIFLRWEFPNNKTRAEGLELALMNKHMNIVDEILGVPRMSVRLYLRDLYDEACWNGYQLLVKYLISNSAEVEDCSLGLPREERNETKKLNSLVIPDCKSLLRALENKKYEIAKILLNDDRVDLTSNNNEFLSLLCERPSLYKDAIEFLLKHPKGEKCSKFIKEKLSSFTPENINAANEINRTIEL